MTRSVFLQKVLPAIGLYALFSITFVHILQQEGLASWGWKAALLIGGPILATLIVSSFLVFRSSRQTPAKVTE